MKHRSFPTFMFCIIRIIRWRHFWLIKPRLRQALRMSETQCTDTDEQCKNMLLIINYLVSSFSVQDNGWINHRALMEKYAPTARRDKQALLYFWFNLFLKLCYSISSLFQEMDTWTKTTFIFHFCDVWVKAELKKAFLSESSSNAFPPCDKSVASPCSYWCTVSAGDWLVHQYRTPIDYTPIDFYVIGNSAARLLSDVPDNTTRLEHLSFTNLLLSMSHLTSHNLPTVKSSLDGYMQIQDATCPVKYMH